MAAGEFGAIQEDGHRTWRAATVMGEVGKTGHRMEHVVDDITSVQKRIELVGLEGVNGHRVEKEMPCWVEAGGWGR